MADILHKTLIIRFSSAGDIVLSSLLVRALRRRFPDCQIDFCVKEEFADLVRFNPHISHVIEFPKDGTFSDLQQLRRGIRANGYDLIIDIHDSLRSRYLCLGAGRVVRVNKRKLARYLLVRFKWNLYEKTGGSPSVALRYVEPVGHLGVEDDGKGLEIFLSDRDKEHVERLIRNSGFEDGERFIGICPSARHYTKVWPKERFAEAAAVLAARQECSVLLLGSEAERARCTEIEEEIRRMNSDVKVLNLAGRLSLCGAAAAMDYCDTVISNDSGLMHIAAARKRTVVAIFGPTVREFGFFPFGTLSTVVENSGLRCRPCSHIGGEKCPEGHFNCMMKITASDVIASADAIQARPQ